MSSDVTPRAAPEENGRLALAMAAFREGRLADAQRECDLILAVSPDVFDANYLLALTRSRSGAHEAALVHYDRALTARPDHAEAHYNRGNALLELKRFEEALSACERALALRPGLVEAHFNTAIALLELRRFEEAALAADATLRLRPSFPEAHKALGDALAGLNRLMDAERCFRRALELRRGFVSALANLGNLLMRMRRYPEAAAALTEVLKLHPDYDYALGALIESKMHCCDWGDLNRLNQELLRGIRSGRAIVPPFVLLSLPGTPADQLINARRHSETRVPVAARQPSPSDRIRLAYLSADFNRHPMPELIVGLFEKHDRRRFEAIGISFGADDGSDQRRRVEKAFDRFIDVQSLTDLQIATLLTELGVDIAIDLMGYTGQLRAGILAHRPAPVQVSYLGFPGTMGAGHIDYIIADRHVIPDSEKQFYTEQVVHLPDSYLVNDDRRQISDEPQTRAMHGLDDGAFVFCCFCATYKITEDVFDTWMRMLDRVPGSLLWLRGTNESVPTNLRQAAASHGIAPDRLVFAPRMEVAKHLARHRLADLALDTLPYNGHTTTSDALWTGLPVVTRAGGTFVGRVAASLLHAVGLPELVTDTMQQYEELAVRLATDGSYLQQIRGKLARNRLTEPLFDTDRFRRHMEAAYQTMWDLWQRGDASRSFSIAALPRERAELPAPGFARAPPLGQ